MMKFIRKHKKKLIIGGIVIVLLLALAAVFGLFNGKDQQAEQHEEKHYSKLTGIEVDKDISERPILGIMIENSRQARPQTGLDSAGIVFEAVTEGGITRYLALYQEEVPEIVGPVRSLRTHFLDWLMGFEASIAHVGGSAEALELADQRKARSLSQFKYAEPYYRDNSRSAPHNMYVKTKDLTELQSELDHKNSQFGDIPRKDPNPSANNNEQPQADSQGTQTEQPQKASKVAIDFSSAFFKVEFRYNAAANSYTRYLNGEPHIDKATGKPITVKNVIVIKAKGLSAGLDVLGSGEALVFNDGNVEEVSWRQDTFQDRIKITDSNNNEIPLVRGDSWFAAVAKDRPVTF